SDIRSRVKSLLDARVEIASIAANASRRIDRSARNALSASASIGSADNFARSAAVSSLDNSSSRYVSNSRICSSVIKDIVITQQAYTPELSAFAGDRTGE